MAREDLLSRLAASESPIVALVAPAGYGKTTLLGQLAERSVLPSAWLSLDQFDNDPSLLFRYLGAALAPIDGAVAADWSSALDDMSTEPGWVLRRLAILVSTIRTPFLLVIDQVEAVTDPNAGDLVAAMALNLPAGSRLALGSRTSLPLRAARLHAAGQLDLVTTDELAMDVEEAGVLLRAMDRDLDDVQLDSLVERTEGWPVGLYLAGLSLDPPNAPASPVHGAAVGDDAVADYLRAEVVAMLPPATTEFLVRSSVLDRLSAPLCDAVLGVQDSRAVLSSLEQANLLLVALDRERVWFRCHRLLRDVLAAELRRTEPEIIGRLHDRAAGWFEADGQLELAIEHAMAAGDADRAARLVATVNQQAHQAGRAETFRRWISWFDERGLLARYPAVAISTALEEALTGRPQRVDRIVAELSTNALGGRAPDGSPIAAWVLFLQAVLARSGIKQMLDDASRVRTLLSVDSRFLGPAAFVEGMALYVLDEHDAADAALADSAELAARYGGMPSGAAAIALRSVIAMERGDWRPATDLAFQALDIVHELHLEAHVQSILVKSAAARAAARAGDVARARACLAGATRCRPRCTRGLPISGLLLVQLAHAHLALADPGGARAVLRQARDVISPYDGFDVVERQCAEVARTLDTIKAEGSGASSLTAAELRLLPFLATHLSYREIGERLFVSRNTVKTEAVSTFRKLGVSSRAEAVDAAERWGLLSS